MRRDAATARSGDVGDAVRDWLRERDRYWSEVAVAETSCLGMWSEDGVAVVQPHDERFAEVEADDVPTLVSELCGAAVTDPATAG